MSFKKIMSGMLICGLMTSPTVLAQNTKFKLQLFFQPSIMDDVTGEIVTDISIRNVDLAVPQKSGDITRLEWEYEYDSTKFDVLKNDDGSVAIALDSNTLVSDKSKLEVTEKNGKIHIICTDKIEHDGTLCRFTLVSKNVSALWNSFDTYPIRFTENSIRATTENDGEYYGAEGIDGNVGAYNVPPDLDTVPKNTTMVFNLGSSQMQVNGVNVEMDAVPYTKDKTFMIPMRYYAQSMGMEVEWDGEKVIASAYGRNMTLKASVNDGIFINSALCETEFNPEITNERMYIPFTVILEQYPNVEYTAEGNQLSIYIP